MEQHLAVRRTAHVRRTLVVPAGDRTIGAQLLGGNPTRRNRTALEEQLIGTDVQLQVIRESFGRVLYTHKTHEMDRERLTFLGTVSKWANIFLSGLTFGGVIATVGTDDPLWLSASLVLATLSAGYAVFQLSFDPNKKAGSHRAAAKQFLVIRNQYVHLMADIVEGILTPDQIRARRDELEKDTADAILVAPDTSNKAYIKAQKALQVDEDMTFGDEELNMFLPAALAYIKPPN